MTIRVDTGDAHATPHVAGEIQLVLTFSVDDAERLWDAAALRCTQVSDELTLADIIETIGPREDPSLEDCIKILTLAPGLAGCTISSILVRQAQARKMMAIAEIESRESLPEAAPAPIIELPHLYNHLPFNPKPGTGGAFHGIP